MQVSFFKQDLESFDKNVDNDVGVLKSRIKFRNSALENNKFLVNPVKKDDGTILSAGVTADIKDVNNMQQFR
jgi:hypothetical protein